MRWTVFKSQFCGFAAQKNSTKLQLKNCRLARRYRKRRNTIKSFIFSIAILFSAAAYSSCELEAYKDYLNLVNEEFLEAASTMSEADPVNYSLVKEFVVLHVEFNNLKIYAAEKLVANGSSLVDTSNTIPKFIKQEFRALPDGTLIRVEEDELSSDVHYKKLNNSLEHFKRFYLFGFKLEGSERERWNEFAKAREIFNTYIEKTKSAPAVKAAFSKNFKEVCKL